MRTLQILAYWKGKIKKKVECLFVDYFGHQILKYLWESDCYIPWQVLPVNILYSFYPSKPPLIC